MSSLLIYSQLRDSAAFLRAQLTAFPNVPEGNAAGATRVGREEKPSVRGCAGNVRTFARSLNAERVPSAQAQTQAGALKTAAYRLLAIPMLTHA